MFKFLSEVLPHAKNVCNEEEKKQILHISSFCFKNIVQERQIEENSEEYKENDFIVFEGSYEDFPEEEENMRANVGIHE